MSVITLRDPQTTFSKTDRVYRDGIELEKGAIITESFLEKNENFLAGQLDLWTVYPDTYLDTITPKNQSIALFMYQRIFLRACMRYRQLYITAARATSKTFLSLLAKYLQCIFIPGHRSFIVAPNKSQAAKIAKQKIQEFWRIWPLLKNELEIYNGQVRASFGKDSVEIYFKNGSYFSVVGALDSDRGLRNHSGLLDELRDLDGDMVSEVILPQLNVSRRMLNGLVNPYEKVNQQIICATSAGSKTSYAYEKLIDMFCDAIIHPKESFVIGLDYRIPAMHGLIDLNYVNKLRMSSAYDEATFAAEFLGTWIGGSTESWFDFEKIQKYRKIKNPELFAKYRDKKEIFYLISVDVGRLIDSTVACVFRINIKDGKYYSTLVDIEVLGKTAETKTFTQQAIDIKLLAEKYNPKEILIDTNGLGIGLADEMIKTQVDGLGRELPPYGFFNDDSYKKIQPKDCVNILYSMKANGPLKSKIHGNTYARLNGGLVRLLISEQEARTALLNTQKGRKMSTRERAERLLPHEITTKMIEEMCNLRAKRTGLDIVLEPINTRFHDDKYMSFAYGLWRIKELEEEDFKKKKKRSGKKRQLIFFTGGT
jgi:hypothetical protein